MTNSEIMATAAWKLMKISRDKLQVMAQEMIKEAGDMNFSNLFTSHKHQQIITVKNGLAKKATIVEVLHTLAPKLALKSYFEDDHKTKEINIIEVESSKRDEASIKPQRTRKQTAHTNWRKAIKMAQMYQDKLTLCEDKSDFPYLEKEESKWNQKAKDFRAIYLKAT